MVAKCLHLEIADNSVCAMTITEDQEYEYEEQEELLYLDLKGVVQSEITQETLKTFKLLGVHQPSPVLQIGGLMFQGPIEPTLGTAVLFQEEDPAARVSPPAEVFSKKPDKMLQFACKAHNMVQMKRIFVKPRLDAGESGSAVSQVDCASPRPQ
ncbi:Transcription factor TFIIIC tau55-related [Trinorchestia longiramus]|nr:Transcription factor TFIIIC tau55-related [Trinorchestia longiramus]